MSGLYGKEEKRKRSCAVLVRKRIEMHRPAGLFGKKEVKKKRRGKRMETDDVDGEVVVEKWIERAKKVVDVTDFRW